MTPEPKADPTLRPIGAWKPEQLGIHPAIKVPGSALLDNRLPRYVERQHDRELRDLLVQLPAEPRMIVLIGEAATGKTRTAYEAVKRCLPGRPLVVPGSPGELPGLLADRLPATPCVVWIDDAREYLQDATAVSALHKLLSQPYGAVVVIAALWPVHWNEIGFAGEKGSEESRARARRVLECAIRFPVPDSFDRAGAITTASHSGAVTFLRSGGFVATTTVFTGRRGDPDVQVTRFNPDGSIASTGTGIDYAGQNGALVVSDVPAAVVIQAYGQAVIGGTTQNPVSSAARRYSARPGSTRTARWTWRSAPVAC